MKIDKDDVDENYLGYGDSFFWSRTSTYYFRKKSLEKSTDLKCIFRENDTLCASMYLVWNRTLQAFLR